MYVRFTIPSEADCLPHATSTGIFCLGGLIDGGRFNQWQREVLAEDLAWFGANLRKPTDLRSGRAVCWFRPEAREVISRAWRMAQLIESIGVPVRVHRQRDPGLIVCRDDFQVAALAWRMRHWRCRDDRSHRET